MQAFASKLNEQFRNIRNRIKNKIYKNPLGFLVGLIIVFILVLIVWNTHRLDNLGFDKTFWDWMDLLIIPVILGIGAWLLSQLSQSQENLESLKRAQADRDSALDMQRKAFQEETLTKYFDHMTELLIDKELRDSQETDDVRIIARARTLTVLRDLDKEGKGQVLRFLYESNLIISLTIEEGEKKSAIINMDQSELIGVHLPSIRLNEAVLNGANLNGANLQGAYLNKISLIRSQLQSAKLDNAKLEDAVLNGAMLNPSWLNGAMLKNAQLSEVNLTRAYLHNADLTGAKLNWSDLKGVEFVDAELSDADLTGADLTGANLTGADLTNADLTDADLTDADLTGAFITVDQLGKVKFYEGAIMPDGSKNYEYWFKSKEQTELTSKSSDDQSALEIDIVNSGED